MDLDNLVGMLYRLPPGEFISARDARAAEARREGDGELAAAVKKLRRPTTGAWLANLLAHERGTQLAELLELGAAMRRAQAQLAGGDSAGSELRRLSQQRHQVVKALADEAWRRARDLRQPVSSAAARELEGTLEAAFADAEAAEVLRAGHLATALTYSGLGPVDVPVDVAAHVARPTDIEDPEPSVPGRVPPDGGRSTLGRRWQEVHLREDRKVAAGALAEAMAKSANAEQEERGQQRRVRDARVVRDQCRRQVADTERRLGDLRDAEEQAERELGEAEKARDNAVSTFRAAREEVVRLKTALDRLGPRGAS